MKSHRLRRARLSELVGSGRTIPAPGATDALSAKLVEKHGFEAAYIGGHNVLFQLDGSPVGNVHHENVDVSG